jgi:hypothetical protein
MLSFQIKLPVVVHAVKARKLTLFEGATAGTLFGTAASFIKLAPRKPRVLAPG